jgi:DNA-binding transcriptional LysR family regulator
VAVRSSLTVSTADAAIAASILGLGLTRVLSYQVEAALREGQLVRVLAEVEPPAVPASLIYLGQGRLPMKTRAFIDCAVARRRQRLQALDTQVPGAGAEAVRVAASTTSAVPDQAP